MHRDVFIMTRIFSILPLAVQHSQDQCYVRQGLRAEAWRAELPRQSNRLVRDEAADDMTQ